MSKKPKFKLVFRVHSDYTTRVEEKIEATEINEAYQIGLKLARTRSTDERKWVLITVESAKK